MKQVNLDASPETFLHMTSQQTHTHTHTQRTQSMYASRGETCSGYG